jgi:hypothetical protein
VSLSMNDILDIGGDGAARERERRSNSLSRTISTRVLLQDRACQATFSARPHFLSASSVSCLASALWMIQIQKAVTRPWIELTVSR